MPGETFFLTRRLTTLVFTTTTVFMNSAATRPSLLALKTLRQRLTSQARELETCTTAAQTRCVKQAIADTERQLTEVVS